MIRRLIIHNLRTHQEMVLMEADEKRIIRYIRDWFGELIEIPMFEWFIPNPNVPNKYMIQTAIKEG